MVDCGQWRHRSTKPRMQQAESENRTETRGRRTLPYKQAHRAAVCSRASASDGQSTFHAQSALFNSRLIHSLFCLLLM